MIKMTAPPIGGVGGQLRAAEKLLCVAEGS